MDTQWQTGHGYKVNGGNRDTKSQVYDLKIHNIKKSTSHLDAKPQTSLKESCPIFSDSHAKVLWIQALRELLWLALQAQGSELDPQNYLWEEEWSCAFVNSAGNGKTEVHGVCWQASLLYLASSSSVRDHFKPKRNERYIEILNGKLHKSQIVTITNKVRMLALGTPTPHIFYWALNQWVASIDINWGTTGEKLIR